MSELVIVTPQRPRLVVESESTLTSCSADALVGDRYSNKLAPLHLPVTPSTQSFFAEDLKAVAEPLWVIRVRLLLLHVRDLPVPLRQ